MHDHATLMQNAATFVPLRLRMHPGGYTIDLKEPDLVLGRHSEADLRMPMPDVSRHHCRFVHSAGGWELIDLKSLNGVYVNGARVERAMLHAGDTVRICSMEFEVAPADCPEPALSMHKIIETLEAGNRKAS